LPAEEKPRAVLEMERLLDQIRDREIERETLAEAIDAAFQERAQRDIADVVTEIRQGHARMTAIVRTLVAQA
ncbi:hypothetical protein, partial [Shewanella algae]|uniref:hypothetical protein n=1 Tax=Shewanella algae TaxID=38313 RepID=UPI00313B1B31